MTGTTQRLLGIGKQPNNVSIHASAGPRAWQAFRLWYVSHSTTIFLSEVSGADRDRHSQPTLSHSDGEVREHPTSIG